MSVVTLVRFIFVVMFILPGLLSCVVGVTGSSWFFTSSGTSFFRGLFGQKGARVFYALLGVILIICGVVGLLYPEQVFRKY